MIQILLGFFIVCLIIAVNQDMYERSVKDEDYEDHE